MRAGPQLRVAKAARAPPCTLPILGRRLHSHDEQSLSPNYLTIYLALFRLMQKKRIFIFII